MTCTHTHIIRGQCNLPHGHKGQHSWQMVPICPKCSENRNIDALEVPWGPARAGQRYCFVCLERSGTAHFFTPVVASEGK